MPDWDDILGAQQDELARGRYDLAKAIEGAEGLEGCRTPMEVFARYLERDGEEGFKRYLAEFVKRLPFVSKPEAWVARAFAAIQGRDEATFNMLFNPFGVAGLGLGP